MLSIGLWRWYINISITILDTINRPVFCLKVNSTLGLSVSQKTHYVSATNPAGPGVHSTKIITRSRKVMFLESRARPVRMVDNLTAICEPIV
jgi:hypothetical protein